MSLDTSFSVGQILLAVGGGVVVGLVLRHVVLQCVTAWRYIDASLATVKGTGDEVQHGQAGHGRQGQTAAA